MKLERRIALVTGARRGIGAAVCRRFAAEGCAVAINYMPEPEPEAEALAEALARDIEQDGGRAIAVGADVSDRLQVDAMVDTVARELGSVDVLVANAAAVGRMRWTDIDEATWDHLMAVNLRGAFLCARAVYPAMRAKGYGKIITLSSITVDLGDSGSLHYVTSKAGLIGFTRALAREVGPEGIRVNCVMPGAVLTEQELEFDQQPHPIPGRTSPIDRQSLPGRVMPEDLVGTFVFLASRDSDQITGQVIAVDAGVVHR